VDWKDDALIFDENEWGQDIQRKTPYLLVFQTFENCGRTLSLLLLSLIIWCMRMLSFSLRAKKEKTYIDRCNLFGR
jgi:hypothetical protein